MEDIKIRRELDMPAVPYRSTVQSLTAVISGEAKRADFGAIARAGKIRVE